MATQPVDSTNQFRPSPAPQPRRPLISIVTAVLNGARTLENAIASVQRQKFRDFEYIVMDGGSADATIEILKRWDHSITTWRSAPDSGIYAAWNKALGLARGEWIAFLGADDIYCDDALERYAVKIAEMAPLGVLFISSRVQIVKRQRVVRTVGRPWSWPAFSRFMTAAHVGAMHHHSLFEEFGQFDETYRICGDYEFLLRPRDRLRAAFLDQVTVQMASGGVSTSNLRLALSEQARAKRLTGGRSPLLCAFEHRSALLRARLRQLILD
jgi:glycosyltransferase involved in cell wall biosynthesis